MNFRDLDFELVCVRNHIGKWKEIHATLVFLASPPRLPFCPGGWEAWMRQADNLIREKIKELEAREKAILDTDLITSRDGTANE